MHYFAFLFFGLAGYAYAECSLFLVKASDVAQDSQNPTYTQLKSEGLIAEERGRDIPPEAFEVGAFALPDFLSYWNAMKTYRGGAIYLQLLLKWAQRIEDEMGKKMADLFLVSTANRCDEYSHPLATVFSSLPSLWDLRQVTLGTPGFPALSRELIHAKTEQVILQGLEALKPALYAEESPRDYFRRTRKNLPKSVRVRFREVANDLKPYLVLNLRYAAPDREIREKLIVQVTDGQELWLGGAITLSPKLATQLRADLLLVERALVP